MRILIAIDTLSLGGAERVLATFARAGRSADLEIALLTTAAPEAERGVLLPLLRASGLRPRSVGVRKLADPRSFRRLAAAIRASGCDVVHAHLAVASTLVPPAAALCGVPSVCTLHHVPGPLARPDAIKERLAVEAASRSAALIFVSEAARRGFARRYGDRGSWRVVPNGVDLTEFSPATGAMPRGLGVPAGAPVVTLVGALRPGKGHRAALDAWPSILGRSADARLLFVGAGPLEHQLAARARELRIEHRVIFAGLRADVPAVLRASSLVVLPSATEALPTTLIEAAACGKAVVATDVGGVGEVVDDGVTGVLVPPRETRAFAEAVAGLLAEPARRAAMGAAARRLAEDRFDMHVWVRRLIDLYRMA